MEENYRMVCIITITEPYCSPEDFEREIDMFNKANDGINVEVQSIDKES